MKTKLTATTAAIAALIGLSSVAHADLEDKFTPVEDLTPGDRQSVFQKINDMTNGAGLDWDRVSVGVDETGQVVVVLKETAKLQMAGAPSSFGR